MIGRGVVTIAPVVTRLPVPLTWLSVEVTRLQ